MHQRKGYQGRSPWLVSQGRAFHEEVSKCDGSTMMLGVTARCAGHIRTWNNRRWLKWGRPRGWRSSSGGGGIDPNCASSSENRKGKVVAASLPRQIDAAAYRWFNRDGADVEIVDYQ